MGFSFKSLGGGFGKLLDPLNLTGYQGALAADSAQKAAQSASTQLMAGKMGAQQALQSGQEGAIYNLKSGFKSAADQAKSGYDTAQKQYQTQGAEAVNTAKAGYDEAQNTYKNDPNMVASRQELYQRILGKGGLSPDTMNALEAKTREEYGTGLRGAEQSLSQFLGDSEARGLAGENLARTAATLGSNRANAIRDIETQNEQLKRTEQTGAINTAMQDTYQQAGLSKDEAEYVSGLQMKMAEGGANLTAQETNALSQLAAQEGISLADLVARFATGTSSLSSEEAAALANITMGTNANVNTYATSGGLQGMLGT